MPVRVIVRSTSDVAGLPAQVELAPSGLTEVDAVAEACRGATHVVHAAGGGVMRRPEDLQRSNVETTRVLVEALRRADAPVQRFLQLSSLAAHGPGTREAPATEDVSGHPRSCYGHAKRDAERCVREARLPALVLRPPAVYGPGDTRMLPVFCAVARGFAPRVSQGWTSLIHIQDLVQAMHCLLSDDGPAPSGQAFFVEDGHPLTQAELLVDIGAAVGCAPRGLRVPSAVLWGLGGLSEAKARLWGPPTAFTRDKVRDLLAPGWVCSSAALRTATRWKPQVRRQDGLKQTAEDYRRRGWL